MFRKSCMFAKQLKFVRDEWKKQALNDHLVSHKQLSECKKTLVFPQINRPLAHFLISVSLIIHLWCARMTQMNN